MFDALSELGLDPDDLDWKQLSLCSKMDTNMFYDGYESDVQVAKLVDQVCLSCPVMPQCIERGVENSEWGVWGAVYLVSGKQDKNRNAHKTAEVWEAIGERIGE